MHEYVPAVEKKWDVDVNFAGTPGRPKSDTSRKGGMVDPKSWPKFDGSGPLDAFLMKFEYFMMGSDLEDDEKARKLVELTRGRAFTWLSQ